MTKHIFFSSHRCTWVENPGDGEAQIFDKIPRGRGFPYKIARGSPNLGFIVFLLKILLKFSWGALMFTPFPLIPLSALVFLVPF